MSDCPTHRSRLRAAALGVAAVVALLAACERQLPTSADIAAMDAAAAESHLAEMGILAPESGVVIYYLDGVQVSADVARAVPADRITGAAVLREPEAARIQLQTRREEAAFPGTIRADTVRELKIAMAREGSPLLMLHGEARDGAAPAAGGFAGLIILDGTPAPPSALRGLRPEQIERVEIIKGEAAVRMYDDPRAAQGVIRITTREGPAPR